MVSKCLGPHSWWVPHPFSQGYLPAAWTLKARHWAKAKGFSGGAGVPKNLNTPESIWETTKKKQSHCLNAVGKKLENQLKSGLKRKGGTDLYSYPAAIRECLTHKSKYTHLLTKLDLSESLFGLSDPSQLVEKFFLIEFQAFLVTVLFLSAGTHLSSYSQLRGCPTIAVF